MALVAWTRVKVRLPGVSVDYGSGEESQFTETQSASGSTLLGYYCQNIFEMKNYTGAYSARERGMFGIHWLNTTAGSVDTTWTTADFTAVESAVQTMWNGLSTYISPDCKLIMHRWYAFGPGVLKPNPVFRETTLGTPISGGGTGAQIHQVASTITLRTALRKHWGRFYLPISCNLPSTSGQMSSTQVDNLASAARTMLIASEATQGITPVVYDRARGNALSVLAIEADSVPDIIRRRRPRDTGYKKIYTS